MDKNGVIWVKSGSDKRKATSREEIQASNRLFLSSRPSPFPAMKFTKPIIATVRILPEKLEIFFSKALPG
jgi:hypothetical protein